MITIEMVEEFRRRTNCSYDDAKYYLEKYNGDMLEAIVAFERDRNRGYQHQHAGHAYGYGYRYRRSRPDFGQRIMKIFQRLLDIRIVIADNSGRSFSIPILFPLILAPLWHVMILISVGMMILGYRFSIREMRDDNYDLNSIISRIRERTQARSK
ncbi:MAG TPA: hypothetical protein PK369_04360 [Thermoclostridium sp.]|nr:hypothetical protein [Clostridiaceae bacterium]HOQ75787.1 hypothetical protein [Thermoclostridium sp.]HPU45434.1 hypothetical protein [Thermoclostridium sp.]